MKTYKEYLVGGAVRDEILGLNPKDLDYVFVFDNLDEDINITLQNNQISFSTTDIYLTSRVVDGNSAASERRLRFEPGGLRVPRLRLFWLRPQGR